MHLGRKSVMRSKEVISLIGVILGKNRSKQNVYVKEANDAEMGRVVFHTQNRRRWCRLMRKERREESHLIQSHQYSR